MRYDSIGFIGGGRITRIIITALEKAGRLPKSLTVSDADPDTLARLKQSFPFLVAAANDNAKPAACDLVFVSLHPPVLAQALGEVRSSIRPDAVVVSLAPKISIAMLSNILDGHGKVVRMIPNAPTVINRGYNPVAFPIDMSAEDKADIIKLFSILGTCPEVPEQNLEAYAIIAAMGPTYFWFQWQTLKDLAESFGLMEKDARDCIAKMVTGALDTMFASSLSPGEVMDLVPVKPLAADEEAIKEMYRSRLKGLFAKLKG